MKIVRCIGSRLVSDRPKDRGSRSAPAGMTSLSMLLLVCVCLVMADPARADEVFTVYVGTDGSDANDGSSPSTAVKTLGRVQEVLITADPQTDVEVRIKQGIYIAPTTEWFFYISGHSISFIPIDYEPGDGINDIAGRPVLRGDGTLGYWFSARLPNGYPGGDTNLNFRYLQVERYSTGGLQFYGGTEDNDEGITVPSNGGVNGNIVFGMMFYKLGSKYASGEGRGSINTWNSSDNLIQSNHFFRNENVDSELALIHGVYLAHHSNRNVIISNSFNTISGDPIRIRNDSNDNHIFDNDFVLTGLSAYYSDWFCDQPCVDSHPGHGRECASHGNAFYDNVLQSGYDGGPPQSVWHLTPSGLEYPGGPGCYNKGQLRLYTHAVEIVADITPVLNFILED